MMRRHCPLVLPLLLSACAGGDAAQRSPPPPSSLPSSLPSSSSQSGACATARAAAEGSWQRHFGRVPDLSPEDRGALATEHAQASPADLERLEEAAREGGDEGMLDAIEASRRALAACA
jgi:hypothetical protein